jgi:serine/threonine protein kinase
MRCPPTEILSRYVGGNSDAPDAEVAQHLTDCPHCRAALTRIDSAEPAGNEPVTVDLSSTEVAATIASEKGFTSERDVTHDFDVYCDSAASTARAPDSEGTTDYRLERGASPPEPTAPAILVGRYEILRRLGRGSFGSVYLARDTELDRLVAIKLAHRERIRKPEDVQLYLFEAKALAALDHPHILPIFDVGRAEDGSCFVVTKFIEGTDLASLVHQSPPSQAEAARLIARIAEGLDHAHRQGLVHRDIKPANILIDGEDTPRLTDFGLAFKRSDQPDGATIAGTPAYLAPEQITSGRIDERTDVYALGATMFFAVTGKPPYAGDTPEETIRQVRDATRQPTARHARPNIKPQLATIIRRAMALAPDKRYSDASQIEHDCRCVLAGEEPEYANIGQRKRKTFFGSFVNRARAII